MSKIGGVTKYESIRRYLNRIYLYGFFSREDWTKLGTEKDYDKILLLLREIYPDLEDSAIWSNRRKYPRIIRHYTDSGNNKLTQTYSLYSFENEHELSDLLQIMSFISKQPRSIGDISCHLETSMQNGEKELYSTTRRRLMELEEYGFIRKEKKNLYGKREMLYSQEKDIFADLSQKELYRLYDYVRYAANVTFPRVPAAFLRKSIKRKLDSTDYANPIIFRHYTKKAIFDEDIAYSLLHIIKHHKTAILRFRHNNIAHQLIPLKIRVDARMGRWYLLAWEDMPVIYRLSSFSNVMEGTEVQDKAWNGYMHQAMQCFGHSAFSGKNVQETPVLVEAELHFDGAEGMLYQFCREMHTGDIERENGALIYRAYINDPGELIPFLRSFAPWIYIRPGNHNVDKAICNDLQQMKDNNQ